MCMRAVLVCQNEWWVPQWWTLTVCNSMQYWAIRQNSLIWQFVPLLRYCQLNKINISAHTHAFNGPLSGTTRVSRYQKGKTNSGFYWSKRRWLAVASSGQVCTSLKTDNHASTPPLSFLQAGCLFCRPTNNVKALKANISATLPNYKTTYFFLQPTTDWDREPSISQWSVSRDLLIFFGK